MPRRPPAEVLAVVALLAAVLLGGCVTRVVIVRECPCGPPPRPYALHELKPLVFPLAYAPELKDPFDGTLR